ncbi:MAG: hypothetical protein KGJ57_22745 [Sphingomonadales bacterium]|nr:hypothetical protein [Sphingomonadales bacterium]MDE2172204.1 hypothetical protein [Sphingomonadales bacterium]
MRLVAIAIALVASQAVRAQGLSQTVYAPGDGAPNSITLPILVTASVGGRCGFAPGALPQGTYDAGAIDSAAWGKQFPFSLECTGPSRVAVVSSNGGLLNASAGTLAPGYAALAPYTVAVHLVGGSSTADDNCAVSTLTASASGPCSFRGPSSQTQGLYLSSPSYDVTGSYIQVSAPAYSGSSVLVNGNYTDTLTVTVSASI